MIVSIVSLFILFLFWKNTFIDLKWKISLTVLLLIFRFVQLGLISVILLSVILITMIIKLRWHGSKIR